MKLSRFAGARSVRCRQARLRQSLAEGVETSDGGDAVIHKLEYGEGGHRRCHLAVLLHPSRRLLSDHRVAPCPIAQGNQIDLRPADPLVMDVPAGAGASRTADFDIVRDEAIEPAKVAGIDRLMPVTDDVYGMGQCVVPSIRMDVAGAQSAA